MANTNSNDSYTHIHISSRIENHNRKKSYIHTLLYIYSQEGLSTRTSVSWKKLISIVEMCNNEKLVSSIYLSPYLDDNTIIDAAEKYTNATTVPINAVI